MSQPAAFLVGGDPRTPARLLSCPPAPTHAHSLYRTASDAQICWTYRLDTHLDASHTLNQTSMCRNRDDTSSFASIHVRPGRGACLSQPRPGCAFLCARSSHAGSQASAVLRVWPRRQPSVLISGFLEIATRCTIRWVGMALGVFCFFSAWASSRIEQSGGTSKAS